jgi:drug/metabolite transporter (DMT)-like permease
LDRIHRAGLAWAFVGVVLFSFSLPLTKVAVGGFDPFLTATGRAVIAGGLAAVLLLLRRAPRPAPAQWLPLFYTMLGAVFGWPILLALALQRTTSAHAAVIAAFMPLTTALFAVRRSHERVPRQFWPPRAPAQRRSCSSHSPGAEPPAATGLPTS